MDEKQIVTEEPQLSQEEKKKIQHRVNVLTFGVIGLLAVFLIILAVTKTIDTILFPLGAGIILAIYWVIVDVFPVIWLHSFEGKTFEQKRSYYFYAFADAAGLAGLIYFIMNMSSITGALIYVASMFLKKRFHDEFLGVSEEETEGEPVNEEEPQTEAGPINEMTAGVADEPMSEAEPIDELAAGAEDEPTSEVEPIDELTSGAEGELTSAATPRTQTDARDAASE